MSRMLAAPLRLGARAQLRAARPLALGFPSLPDPSDPSPQPHARAMHSTALGPLKALKQGQVQLLKSRLSESAGAGASASAAAHGLHSTPVRQDEALAMDGSSTADEGNYKVKRFVYTAEVMVSKIFPAGFGWQLSSYYAENVWGLGDKDLGFFLVTGGGDFCGVWSGHFLYYLAKKYTFDKSIKMGEQAHIATWLASAAFMSGGMWQPFVNFFQSEGVDFSFNTALFATMICCGSMFFTGLRFGRYFMAPVVSGVVPCDYANLKADAQLSLAIGGATACFVGTDVSYSATGPDAPSYAAADSNWLRSVVGVEDDMSVLHGACLAGSSTALGFLAVQAGENLWYSQNRCWVD